MDMLPPVSAESSILKRTQKIRERMIVEMISGIHVAKKDVFLSQCRQYEREFTNIKTSTYDRIFWEWWNMEYRGSNNIEEDDWKQWEEWDDWHKFDRSPRAME